MKKIIFVMANFLMVLFCTAIQGSYIETFDNGNRGWKSYNINPGGHVNEKPISWEEDGTGEGYVSADIGKKNWKFLGLGISDGGVFGDLNNSSLTVDYALDGEVIFPEDSKVRFYIGSQQNGFDYFVSSDSYSWNPNSGSGWTTHSVEVKAENFVSFAGKYGGNSSFEQAISNSDDIGLIFSGDFYGQQAIGVQGRKGTNVRIDNFGSISGGDVPEPSTLFMLGAGALFIYTRREQKLNTNCRSKF